MNEPRYEPGLALNPDRAPKPDNLLRSTVAFLKRDIKSFFPSSDKEGESTEQGGAASKDSKTTGTDPTGTSIESLVDESKLTGMAFRRDALDWRDNFHVNLTLTLSSLYDTFAQEVHAELANTSLFRTLVTRESDQVLQDSFTQLVRLPLIATLRNEEGKLNTCAIKWGAFVKADMSFDISALNAECASLHDIGFKPSNKDHIISRCQELVLGSAGLAAVFRDQGLQLSRKLMDTRAS